MLFNAKSIVLYGLIALSSASPLAEFSKRAKISDYKCPDGEEISESDIRKAFHECRRHDDGSIGKYPAYFGNQNNGEKVLANVPDGTDLREFPIIKDGVYTSGSPGKYRVVTDYKDNKGDFRGVIQHTGATVGGAYTACEKI
ncbi:hypothetical protein POX_g08528 [Penicillium oxalicum]|uniref:hypothetical protein n=1 Tax=Penicillium oxalicum TaxID=69781 RepID=UPI0020B84114|nr:hypothetical protein POX_g08528 [Penicillium oxalicum]KAI2786146.1 hypothetical protein POX_g08528 [Penicillium oxalicum]